MSWFAGRAARRAHEDRLAADALRHLQTVYRLEGEVGALRDTIVYLREQVAAKDIAILAMRREGFDPPVSKPADVVGPADEGLPEEVRRALDAVDDETEAQAARRAIKAGRSPEDVAAEIRRGSSLNPFHA